MGGQINKWWGVKKKGGQKKRSGGLKKMGGAKKKGWGVKKNGGPLQPQWVGFSGMPGLPTAVGRLRFLPLNGWKMANQANWLVVEPTQPI